MRAPSFLLILAVVAVGSGCRVTDPPKTIAPPMGWTKIDATEFTFYVPPDVKGGPSHGTDSFVGEYKGNAISFSFDYGIYSDPLKYSDKPGFAEGNEHIDGKTARIVSFHNPRSGYPFDEVIAVHFAEAGTNGNKLTMFAVGRTEGEYEMMRTIFRTIRFR